ncbi:hypothetical protein AB0N43_24935 [Streptomyces pseudogriseolus]|uniref:hypothetical protein n=1 Tax=Streptomyces pseudogriseolus TaxID=36817 RepID=UPI00347B8305
MELEAGGFRQGTSVDTGLLPVQVPEHPDQLWGVDGIHFGMQPFDLLQHGLPGAVAPLLGFREDCFGPGEIADGLLDGAQNPAQALLTHARELMHQVSRPFPEARDDARAAALDTSPRR